MCSEQLRRVSEEEVCRPGKTVSVLQMSYNFGTDFGTKRQVGKSTGNICLMESGYIHKVTKRQKKEPHHGSLFLKVVGAARFELTASCTRNKRATKLRHAPTWVVAVFMQRDYYK